MASSNVVGSPPASELGENTTRLRGASITSEDRQTLRSERSHRSQKSQRSNREGSIMNTNGGNGYTENALEGFQSPTQNQGSVAGAGIPYDALSVTSRKSGITSDSPVTAITSVSQQPEVQQQLSNHGK